VGEDKIGTPKKFRVMSYRDTASEEVSIILLEFE